MKRVTSLAAACAVIGYIVAAPAFAATYPNGRAVMPTAGFALTGDGGEYRNFDGQNNRLSTPTVPDHPYELIIDWQAGRRLFLNITSNASNVSYPPISYTCVTGPEDPLHPASKNYPAWGATFYLAASRSQANISCYNASHDAGYFVWFLNPWNCMTVTKTPAADPRFLGGDHYTIDGPSCTAHVSVRNGTKLTQIKSGSGKTATPIVFNVPVHVEFDMAPVT